MMDIVAVPLVRTTQWEPTAHLRWVRPPLTTTAPDRLQQLWIDRLNGDREWRDVALVIVEVGQEGR